MPKRSPLIRVFVMTHFLLLSVSPENSIGADQFGSFAVAVPFEKLGAAENAGVVNIIRGSSKGLSASNNQMLYEDAYETGDYFGTAMASGDFNNDGFPDLAVGAPYKNIDGFDEAGMVNVFYGTSNGLARDNNQIWHQNSPEIDGAVEASDYFGEALASGDFNNDGFCDLAIGVTRENIGDIVAAGAVNIICNQSRDIPATMINCSIRGITALSVFQKSLINLAMNWLPVTSTRTASQTWRLVY